MAKPSSLAGPQGVHDFWFGAEFKKNPTKNSKMWWARPEGLDEEVAQKFGPTLDAAAKGELETWSVTPQGHLALILVLDQFPRHIFRGQAQAFAYDKQAQELCLKGLERRFEAELHAIERQFFLLPLQHSEDLALQERSVFEYARLVHAAPPDFQEAAKGAQDFAIRHFEIIRRFGRFPHRNKALERESTPEEIEFLKTPGSSF